VQGTNGARNAELFICTAMFGCLREMAHWPYQDLNANFRSLAFEGWLASLVSSSHQYIEYQTRSAELYDWIADKAQEHNLAATREGKTAAETLAAEFRRRTPQRVTGNHPPAP